MESTQAVVGISVLILCWLIGLTVFIYWQFKKMPKPVPPPVGITKQEVEDAMLNALIALQDAGGMVPGQASPAPNGHKEEPVPVAAPAAVELPPAKRRTRAKKAE